MSTTATFLERTRAWSPRSKRIAAGILAVGGFAGILGWVVGSQNLGAVIGDFETLGAAIGLVIAAHVVVITCDAAAWRALLRRELGTPFAAFIWARWVREATNMLLPVAQVGGEVIGARILSLRGLSTDLAGGSVILDKLSEALSQIPFTVIGLLLMLALRGQTQITETVALGLFVAVAGVAALVLARHTSGFRAIEDRIGAWIARETRPLLKQVERFAQAVRAIYRAERMAAAIGWHLAAWIIGAGEVWLALALMGHPISVASALALESLGQAITGLGFMVPAALGVQEGAYIVIGAALGLPVETALALSLVKRVRQIILGVPALCSWQALELSQFLSPAVTTPVVPPKAPSSHSNAYVRRFMRTALRPFAASGLTPNALTWTRIATGVGACVACAVGTTPWNHAAALLWLFSALLDRSDGEFARMTHHCSERGRLLDYHGDVVINALIFLAIGINLRHAGLGDWSIGLGGVAFAAVAMAGVLAEALELRIGQKTVPSRHGFDFDDVLFVLVPILWLGYLMPLLIGAAIGGSVAALYIWHRLSRLAEPVVLRIHP